MTDSRFHFNKLVEIYNTTGKCFTYWTDCMTTEQRKELAVNLGVEFNWALVLEQVGTEASLLRNKN